MARISGMTTTLAVLASGIAVATACYGTLNRRATHFDQLVLKGDTAGDNNRQPFCPPPVQGFISIEDDMATVSSVTTPSMLGISADDWSAFASIVNGRLNVGIPFSAPCFATLEGIIPTANVSLCNIVQATYNDEYPRISTFGSQTNTQWETCQKTGDQCLLDWTDPDNPVPTSPPYQCKWGSISPLYVEVKTPDDVIKSFKFSNVTKIPVIIRNTGHDYQGRSSAPKSLGLSVKTLKKLEYSNSFVPEGCSSSKKYLGLTTGAGVTWAEAYAFADQNKVDIAGGSDGSVGATGGFLQGGGHGPLGDTFGLAADRALQFKIVTPDGKYRTANACQNSDLFWALRGGGGGTFGVVFEATHKVEPARPYQVTFVGWTGAPNRTLTEEFWKMNLDNAERWADLGLAGFTFPQLMVYVTPVLNATAAAAAMKPALDFGARIKAMGVDGAISVQDTQGTFLGFFNTYVAPSHANTGKPQPVASRLVPRPNFKSSSSRADLLEAFMNAYDLTGGNVWLLATAPTKYTATPASDISVNPAWRNTVYEVVLWTLYNYNSTIAEKKAAYTTTSQAIDFVRELTPDAAYLNEADVYEPNWQYALWGDNYSRLLTIKNKYDPDHLLDCWHCVGWQPESSRFSCYL